MKRRGQNSRSQLAWVLLGLALFFLVLGWPEPPSADEKGQSTHNSVEPQSEVGPADLTQTRLELERRRHQLMIDFERMTSENPSVRAVQGRPMDHGVRLESEQIQVDPLQASIPSDPLSPRHEILRHLKAMQDHDQWRKDRNEAFIHEVLRRARADGWIVQLDENLKVMDVRRAPAEPYKDPFGSAAR